MDNQKEAYKVEAYELLAELETSLLELEVSPDDFDLVDRVFRAMHTIKGSGALFGFDGIAEFTHDVETVFDLVRDGCLPVTTHLVNLALRAVDYIRLMLDADDALSDADYSASNEILAGFRVILGSREAAFEEKQNNREQVISCFDRNSDIPVREAPVNNAQAPEGEKIYRIRFKPDGSLFHNGTNPLSLIAELNDLGRCRTILHTDHLPPADSYDPERCYLYWDIFLTTDSGVDAIKDVFIFVEGNCELTIDMIDDLNGDVEGKVSRRLGEILVERGDLQPEQVAEALRSQKRLGQILVSSRQISEEKVKSALTEQEYLQAAQRKRERSASATSVRVAAEKLDTLVNLVG